jgi:hypothetical protein
MKRNSRAHNSVNSSTKRTKTNHKRSTNSEVERIVKDIRSLALEGKSDSDIRALLGLELRMYQKYTKRIHEEDKQVWYDIASQELESELLRLRTCLNNTYNIAKKLSEDETAKIDERLEACQAASDARLSLVQILREYPIFIKTKNNLELEEQEDNDITESTLKRIH